MTPRRTVPVLLLLAIMLAVTGCVAIPDSSAPQPVEQFNRTQPTNLVPTPRRSDDPETVVRNFLKAMADPASGHKAARRFLTTGASSRWDDQGPTTVLDDVRVVVDERNESAIRLRVIGTRVGVLSTIGQLTPVDGEMVMPLTLNQVKGSWRVEGDLEPGTVTDRTQFDSSYRLAQLFYPDRTATRLVGDPRWLFGGALDPTAVVTRLLAGPAPDLTGAVESPAGKDVELRGPVAIDGDTVTINLGGLVDADPRNRTVLAAQLIWTLDAASFRGTYRITSDGSPLVADRADGWRTADVKSFDPEPDTGQVPPLHVVRGGLLRVTSAGTAQVSGPLGSATDLRAAALSADQTRVAAVADRGGRRVLLQGPYGGIPTEVVSGGDIVTPGFGATADVGYAVVDGKPVQWTTDQAGAARVVPLDISQVAAIDPRPITAFQVSPDGVRAALLVGGRVLLAVLTTNDRGVPSLSGVHQTAYDIGSVVALAWGGIENLYLARTGDDAPVLRIPVSGVPALPLVSGNLKPPVVALAATRTKVYAADSNGILEIGTAPGGVDQYWTSVGDTGRGAIPVS
ncbi:MULTISPECIES: LpqB family beta-propeller domain-containing protein [unclassified Gordonia (in: high G+C Gram-positive bacteria)]|uniref:LpqB family beta-propeller domain-containing protein n=1 Tax=unclassified Gordonia (in: high G+C Gram-positive bacteria) TaxID=2657482 RepID=UPI001FFFEA3E|nr:MULTISPECIES: LpqB family beta-propeller domain-containing protein [unclassified Gordonia (in: high G+C Gram-positive bacteria)]UQE74347.1 LpqB family beta-propeller domain-containing protein [Gordonia sp. PP30]